MAFVLSTATFVTFASQQDSANIVQNVQNTQNDEPDTIFFTQTARAATLEASKDKKNWYTLTLHDVNGETLWFSERPTRKSGTIKTHQFVKMWGKGNDSFSVDHPNANLVAIENNNGVKTNHLGVFVLADPEYNARQRTLTYKVYNIYKSKKLKDSSQLEQVALFIDGICPWGGWCPFNKPNQTTKPKQKLAKHNLE